MSKWVQWITFLPFNLVLILLFVLRFRVAVFIALCLSAATGSFIGDTLESVSYIALKKLMIAAGDSEFHANCFVEVLKSTGTAKDVAEIMINPDGVMEK